MSFVLIEYMTRPDLAFSYSQLSKFIQYRMMSPALVHLQEAERLLQGSYLRSRHWHFFRQLGPNWARNSRTGYLMSLNGGFISVKSSWQAGVTLSSSEAEFVEAGQEVLKGFGCTKAQQKYEKITRRVLWWVKTLPIEIVLGMWMWKYVTWFAMDTSAVEVHGTA